MASRSLTPAGAAASLLVVVVGVSGRASRVSAIGERGCRYRNSPRTPASILGVILTVVPRYFGYSIGNAQKPKRLYALDALVRYTHAMGIEFIGHREFASGDEACRGERNWVKNINATCCFQTLHAEVLLHVHLHSRRSMALVCLKTDPRGLKPLEWHSLLPYMLQPLQQPFGCAS